MSQSEVSKAEAAEERSEETRSFVHAVKAATRRKYGLEEKIRTPRSARVPCCVFSRHPPAHRNSRIGPVGALCGA